MINHIHELEWWQVTAILIGMVLVFRAAWEVLK